MLQIARELLAIRRE